MVRIKKGVLAVAVMGYILRVVRGGWAWVASGDTGGWVVGGDRGWWEG